MKKGKLLGVRLLNFASPRQPKSPVYSYDLLHPARLGLHLTVEKHPLAGMPCGKIEIKDAHETTISRLWFETQPIGKNKMRKKLYLHSALTNPSAEDEGLYRQAFAEAEKLAQEIRAETLEGHILATDTHSLKVHKHFGFKVVGVAPDNQTHYEKGKILVVRKKL